MVGYIGIKIGQLADQEAFNLCRQQSQRERKQLGEVDERKTTVIKQSNNDAHERKWSCHCILQDLVAAFFVGKM